VSDRKKGKLIMSPETLKRKFGIPVAQELRPALNHIVPPQTLELVKSDPSWGEDLAAKPPEKVLSAPIEDEGIALRAAHNAAKNRPPRPTNDSIEGLHNAA
jgi:hypothetical protein